MISIGKQPNSLKEAQEYAHNQAKYKHRVEQLIESVDVYTSAISAMDQSPQDLNSKSGLVILVDISRAQLGLSTGANVGPWPPLPHPGCSKQVQKLDAMLEFKVLPRLEIDEKGPGGRKILWNKCNEGFDSLCQVQDEQGTLKFGRNGDTITILSDQP